MAFQSQMRKKEKSSRADCVERGVLFLVYSCGLGLGRVLCKWECREVGESRRISTVYTGPGRPEGSMLTSNSEAISHLIERERRKARLSYQVL
jgi:hypothetical protein